MEQNEEIVQKLASVYQQIEGQLQAGVTYYSTPAVTTFGTVGGQLFSIENGQRVYVDKKADKLDLFAVTTSFPAYTIVRYTFQKGMPVTVEASTPEMLLVEMELGMKAQRSRMAEMQKLTSEDKTKHVEPADFETHVKFLKKGKMDVVEKQINADGKVYEDDYTCLEKEIEAMYHALDGKIKQLSVSLKGDTFEVHTTPAIPGITSEVIEKPAELTLDESNLEAIFGFMESHDDAKMAKAVEVLKRNPGFLEKAEKRYLHFIAARLNTPSPSIEQFPEAALQKSEVNTLLGKQFAQDYISLSYFDESKSRLTVDFIGSMVQNAVNLDTYMEKAIQLSDLDELIALYDTYAKEAKSTILEEAKTHPEGWYSQVSTHLINLQLRRVLFEKTQFDEANASPALKGFIFFLNINCSSSVYLDIFQSDEPDLTEMFWMLNSIPDSSWGDTTVKIPASPLKIERSAKYKIGDGGRWKKMVGKA